MEGKLMDLKYAILCGDEDYVIIELLRIRQTHSTDSISLPSSTPLWEVKDFDGFRILDYVLKSDNPLILLIFQHFDPSICPNNDLFMPHRDFMTQLNEILHDLVIFSQSFLPFIKLKNCSNHYSKNNQKYYVELLIFQSSVISMTLAFIFTLSFFISHLYSDHHKNNRQIINDPSLVHIIYAMCLISQITVWRSMYRILKIDPGYICPAESNAACKKDGNGTIDMTQITSNDSFNSSEALLASYELALHQLLSEYVSSQSSPSPTSPSHVSNDVPYVSSRDYICHHCRLHRPFRSGHSYFSNKCVLRYDHFCSFLYVDVGEKNYYLFILIIFVMSCVAMPSFFVLAITHIGEHIQLIQSAAKWTYSLPVWLFYKILDAYLLWMFLMWLGIMLLFLFHCYLMSRALTSREYYALNNNRNNNSYNNGDTRVCSNIVNNHDTSRQSECHSKIRKRPVYLTESGCNLFAYNNSVQNIMYMLFPSGKFQSISTRYRHKNITANSSSSYDESNHENYCYSIRDLAVLKLKRNRQQKP